MSRIVSILCILMSVAVLNTMAEPCVPVNSYCGNLSPCCPVEKMVNGQLEAVEAICDMTQTNVLRKCKVIDEISNLKEIVEWNQKTVKEFPNLLKTVSLRTSMPEGY
uniref:Uncharacterized protein n=1 Tax=Glyptapanteles indiensis TaxID=92994 RepID=B7S964_GLYIN|nr:conserved hypothetical protein [Glyptapanteles indiensis]